MATARFADIVLPATTTAERNDIDRIGSVANKAILRMAKIIDPVFEARKTTTSSPISPAGWASRTPSPKTSPNRT
ncbi:molybdopterin-dependent oxidoreductase [Breoghania sp.]|uniref:molybdopterin-dependent oxidoreductase n=1 Tax=Breoghania sp. TaxID=2065378 RepID=UPI00260A8F40|nr:molybdopterin-dependent oxidoreductase [Breoghania sp.]MDJ0929740.1 molybdopterin-dependent oxidoreductase [Breoghania sp.]